MCCRQQHEYNHQSEYLVSSIHNLMLCLNFVKQWVKLHVFHSFCILAYLVYILVIYETTMIVKVKSNDIGNSSGDILIEG